MYCTVLYSTEGQGRRQMESCSLPQSAATVTPSEKANQTSGVRRKEGHGGVNPHADKALHEAPPSWRVSLHDGVVGGSRRYMITTSADSLF